MEPTNIYNIINQCFNFPAVSDPSYLLLIGMYKISDKIQDTRVTLASLVLPKFCYLDARETHEYNESHVVTAKKAPKVWKVPMRLSTQSSSIEIQHAIGLYLSRTARAPI